MQNTSAIPLGVWVGNKTVLPGHGVERPRGVHHRTGPVPGQAKEHPGNLQGRGKYTEYIKRFPRNCLPAYCVLRTLNIVLGLCVYVRLFLSDQRLHKSEKFSPRGVPHSAVSVLGEQTVSPRGANRTGLNIIWSPLPGASRCLWPACEITVAWGSLTRRLGIGGVSGQKLAQGLTRPL